MDPCSHRLGIGSSQVSQSAVVGRSKNVLKMPNGNHQHHAEIVRVRPYCLR